MRMRKCQWVHMALLTLCIAFSPQSWALGLGEIEVDSALNERLSGVIDLIDMQGLQSAEIVVSMASREDFERVGVERFFYLTGIDFEVEVSASGNANVNVSSSQPISEPYLNFIVEVLWPNGRLLKEFTILLDPPTYSQAVAPVVSAPSHPVAQTPAQTPERRTQPAVSTRATEVALQPTQSAARQSTASSLMTSRRDTLWKIASRTLPSAQVTVNQQMLAIQRKNPKAFIRANINLLKAGYVLDIPTESEALSLGQRAASQDVAAQTEAWRSGTSRQQVDVAEAPTQLLDDTDAGSATPLRSQIDASSNDQISPGAAGQSEGRVRIVANAGELAAGTASGDEPAVNRLIEEKETLTRQVDELTYQLDREKDIAVNQVTVKDRQLEVKDQELAQLQQQMTELREQLALAAQNQNQSPTPATPQTSWWMSPMVLFGVIGVLILILAFAMVALRKDRSAANEPHEELPVMGDESEPTMAVEAGYDDDFDELVEDTGAVEPIIGAFDEEVAEETDTADETLAFADETADGAADGASSEEGGSLDEDVLAAGEMAQTQTGDVIGEAEIYIAYGRYGQAANLLSGVLTGEPERWEVRLKLLEVCVESHDEENFASHAQYIVDNCEEEDVLLACRELETQLGNSQVDMSAEGASAEDDLGLRDKDAVADAEDGFALELEKTDPITDDDSDIDGTEAAVEADDTPPESIDFELEFDGELDTLDDADEGEERDASDELGGDLGIDFNPDDEPDTAVDTEEDTAEDTAEDTVAEAPSDNADDAGTGTADEVDELEDFEFESEAESDINTTKLDLAEAYVDMGDGDGAQDILKEVLEEGTPEQVQKAQELLDSLVH